jgi:hypothetical protein
MRYDRARISLDRHATYIVATHVAGQQGSLAAQIPQGSLVATDGQTAATGTIGNRRVWRGIAGRS